MNNRRHFISGSVTFLVFVFLYAPILILVLFSFNSTKTTAIWTGFTFEWYVKLFADSNIQSALKNSIIVAASSSAVATTIGILAAVRLAEAKSYLKRLLVAWAFLPLVVPDIVIGVSLAVLYISLNLTFGLTTIIFAHVVFNSAYVLLIILSALGTYDKSIEDAARDLGASRTRIFFTVKLPLILPVIAGCALLTFTLSFDDFIITFMTAGVGATTLPINIYSMTRFGVSPIINAISTIVLLISSVSILVVHLLINLRIRTRDLSRQSQTLREHNSPVDYQEVSNG